MERGGVGGIIDSIASLLDLKCDLEDLGKLDTAGGNTW